jgi:uncharacterized membrane protein YbhN (UPF0104 family)
MNGGGAQERRSPPDERQARSGEDAPAGASAGGERESAGERSTVRRRIVRWALVLLVAGIGLYLVWPALLSVFTAAPRLRNLSALWLLVMVGGEAASFACYWVLLKLAIACKGWGVIITAQVAGNAFSRIVPGGLASGGALSLGMLKGAGVSAGRAATGLAGAQLISTATLVALPLISLPAIIAGLPVARPLEAVALIGAGIFVLTIIAGAALFSFDRPLLLAGRLFEGARRRLHRPPTEGFPEHLLSERDEIRKALGRGWWIAFPAAAGNWLLDFLVLWAALEATGSVPHASVVLLAYVVASVLGMIPVTPGGLGFVEAGLTGALVLAGVSAQQAVLATLAYRVVAYWIHLPLGLLAYWVFEWRYRGKSLGGGPPARRPARV